MINVWFRVWWDFPHYKHKLDDEYILKQETSILRMVKRMWIWISRSVVVHNTHFLPELHMSSKCIVSYYAVSHYQPLAFQSPLLYGITHAPHIPTPQQYPFTRWCHLDAIQMFLINLVRVTTLSSLHTSKDEVMSGYLQTMRVRLSV